MTNTKPKPSKGSSVFAILVSVLLSYAAAVICLPSAGIFSTLPAVAVLSVAASFLCKQRKIIYISMALMPFLTVILFGYGVKRAFIMAILAVVSSFLAILAKRALLTVLKSKDKNAAKKSKPVLAISVILLLAVWLTGYGNPVSFAVQENKNVNLAKERYNGAVETKGSFYDVTSLSYLTEITFDGAQADQKYYICAGKTDDYLDFHISETYLDAVDYFAAQTAFPKEYILCYIDKANFVFGEDGGNLKNTEYLIERTESVTGMSGFADLYDNLMVYANESEELVYKSITLTAPGMDGKTYYAYKEYGKEVVFSVNNDVLKKDIDEKFN